MSDSSVIDDAPDTRGPNLLNGEPGGSALGLDITNPIELSPPRAGQNRKLDDTEFKDTPRTERVWSNRREQVNAGMAKRVPAQQDVLTSQPLSCAGTVGASEGPEQTSGDPFDFVAQPAPDVKKKGKAVAPPPAPPTTNSAGSSAQSQQHAAAQKKKAPPKVPATTTAASSITSGSPAPTAASSTRAKLAVLTMQAPPPIDVDAQSATPPLPPSKVAAAIGRIPTPPALAGAPSLLAPRPQPSTQPQQPGGFIHSENETDFAARTGASGSTSGDDAMDVDPTPAQHGPPPSPTHATPPHMTAILVPSTSPEPAPGPATVKEEEQEVLPLMGTGAESTGGAPGGVKVEIFNPAPASDLDRTSAGRFSQRFARTEIKMSGLKRAKPCTDGHLAGTRSEHLNPSTALKWRMRRQSGEPGVGIKIHSIGGDTNIAAVNQVRLKIEVGEAFQLLLPDESPRVAPALGEFGGTPMPPGVFNLDQIHTQSAADIRDLDFLVIGSICMIPFDWDHGHSEFMATFADAVFPPAVMEQQLKTRCLNSPEIRDVFLTLESRFPGYGTPARQRFADSIHAVPLTVKAPGANRIDYDETNVYAKTAGLIPDDEAGRPQELPNDLYVALREAFTTLYVYDDDGGRAVVRRPHRCSTCSAISHPSGKCPSLTVEGWPKPPQPAAGGNRGRGGPAMVANNSWRGGPPFGAAPRGRGNGMGRGTPPFRGFAPARGGSTRGFGAAHGWGN